MVAARALAVRSVLRGRRRGFDVVEVSLKGHSTGAAGRITDTSSQRGGANLSMHWTRCLRGVVGSDGGTSPPE